MHINKISLLQSHQCRLSVCWCIFQSIEHFQTDTQTFSSLPTNKIMIEPWPQPHTALNLKFFSPRYVDTGDMLNDFPYRARAMFAFEEQDGVDVCFFGMHVQEYGSECPQPNTRRVYVAYLDSVHFFKPRHFRTAVYHEILLGRFHRSTQRFDL